MILQVLDNMFLADEKVPQTSIDIGFSRMQRIKAEA